MSSGNGWGCAGVLGEDGNCLGTGYGGFSGDGVGDGINYGHGRGIITLGDGWGFGMSVGRSNGDGSSNL